MKVDFSKLKVEYDSLQKAILQKGSAGQPIDSQVKRQIEIVEQIHDEYVKKVQEAGGGIINSVKAITNQIYYNSQLATLAEKIGLSAEKYKNKIVELSQRMGLDDIAF